MLNMLAIRAELLCAALCIAAAENKEKSEREVKAMVRIAAAQMRVSDSMEENYKKSLSFIRKASEAGARLVCFPEGQLSRYVPQYHGLESESFALSPKHPYIQGLCAACRENHILASVGVNLIEEDKIYPTMLLIDEYGKILGGSRKKPYCLCTAFL